MNQAARDKVARFLRSTITASDRVIDELRDTPDAACIVGRVQGAVYAELGGVLADEQVARWFASAMERAAGEEVRRD